MVGVEQREVPRAPDGEPLVSEQDWRATPVSVQGLLVALVAAGGRVPALHQQVAALAERVRELEARLGQSSSNSSRPPSSDPPGARGKRSPPAPPSGRRRGGQPGRVGRFRALAPPERVHHVVEHRPAACRACAAPLSGVAASGAPALHQVTELPSVQAQVTEHRLHRVVCPACGVATRAGLPPEVPAGAFGPRLQAAVAFLSGRLRLSRREVAVACEELLDAPLCVGSVDALCQATSDALAQPVADVAATLPGAVVVHADETGWRQAGGSRWLWVATTALVTVFVVAAGRGSRIIKELVGEAFAGILVSDRWSAYGWLDVAYRQVCWAHLARDFQALVDRGGPAAPIGRRALAVVRDLFRAWHAFRDGGSDRARLRQTVAPLQATLGAVLADGSACSDPKAAGLCRALDRLWPALWTFLDEDGVEPTNNAAERALRPAVLWRKGSFGTQSDAGARFVERLLTVTATCRQQGRSVLDYLTAACTAAQAGLRAPSLLPAA
jgi:transposase